MNNLYQFTNKYQLSKTLRFELIPQGKTLDTINSNSLISQDKQRAISYQSMKKTIDGFHKYFIELALRNAQLSKLDDFFELYNASAEAKKEEKFKKDFDKIKTDLRKEIVKSFTNENVKDIYNNLFSKELITVELKKWIAEKDSDDYFDEAFEKFTTYFSGFHENRKNMYTDKDQSTAIAYRIVHENLPKFIDNIKTFNIAKEKPELFAQMKQIEQTMEHLIQGQSLEEIFTLEYFNNCLTQNGISFINSIIGGETKKDGAKIQGLNEYINLYNQQQVNKNNRIPKFKQLFKQILSDRVSISFLPEAFAKDSEVLKAIYDYYHCNLRSFTAENSDITIDVLAKIKNLLAKMSDFDLAKIYLRNDTNITNISQNIFGDYSIIRTALDKYFEYQNPQFVTKYAKAKDDDGRKKLDKQRYSAQDYISIELLQKSLDFYIPSLDKTLEISKKYSTNCIADYFHTHFFAKKETETDKGFDLISNLEAKYSCIQGLLRNAEDPSELKLSQEQKTVDDIKLFLDAILEILWFVKPLHLKSETISEVDNRFYAEFETLFEQLNIATKLYDKVRNYMTKKPYSVEKFKLNFENAQFLGGWDANKESDYLTSILRKDGNYYLCVMDKKHNKVFKDFPKASTSDCYEKLHYKLLPGVNKMLPKVFFSAKNIGFFNPSKELLENYKNDTHKKGDTFNLADCHNLINFFKSSLAKHEDWQHFDFKFSDTNTYQDLSGFYREVEHQGYKVNFENITCSYIEQLVNEGKIYLFQIYNKDFSAHSKGKPNLHTMYWNALFSEDNLKNVVYKLNGQAEMFFRKASITDKNKVVHKVGDILKSKNPLTPDKTNKFDYELTKDKRFTVDKFQFHVPITMNFKAIGSLFMNQQVLEFLKNNKDVNIIGLDRGERHLIYLTLIDQQGNIIKQESLNTISAENFNITTDYHALLDEKEKERDNARKNWSSIENIKELKSGYLSQVVHKIATMMVEHNAIVVMEDLNFGFKRGRFHVEKQVYQKLEKMLIDKLNYLVQKDKAPTETGGLLNALQLTNKFESFQKLGKQSGFLFYVPAWNTSKIDPTTGFVNLFYSKYENIDKAKEFFGKFDKIVFNKQQNYFEFSFDYNNFTDKAKDTKTNWTVCTFGERIKTFRNPESINKWDNKEVVLTDEFITLFKKFNIDYQASNLQQQLIAQTDKAFFESLYYLLKLTLQIRNSVTNSDIDYLISPVMNKQNCFYDSRKANETLPKDADANGAYHIAKKGLWVLEQINKTDDLKKVKLAISNKEWLQFVQKNN